MALTTREKKVLECIKEWENIILSYEPNDFELLYEKYLENSFSKLPENIQQQLFTSLDNWLFYLHALIQGSELQMDARDRILSAGRIFRPDINSIHDMKMLNIDQLKYIAEQQISRHRLYSFVQGGITGTGGILLLGSDIPAIAVINLRVVQLIAATYGFEQSTPYEMMTSLKVFHGSILPPRLRSEAWKQLMSDLEYGEDEYFYEGSEDLSSLPTIEQPLIQLLKTITIILLKKKTFQGLPLISMAIGANSNYQLTKKVTDFTHKFYQMRYLIKKEGV